MSSFIGTLYKMGAVGGAVGGTVGFGFGAFKAAKESHHLPLQAALVYVPVSGAFCGIFGACIGMFIGGLAPIAIPTLLYTIYNHEEIDQ